MKRLRKKASLRKPREAYSLSERQGLLQLFLQERARGVPAKAIAENLKVSIATLYRWQADVKTYSGSSNCMTPTLAMNVLCDRQVENRAKIVEAVIALSVWMRWPTEPQYHNAACAALAVAYVCQTTGAVTLREIDSSSRQLVEAFVSLDIIWKICTPQVLDMPVCGQFRIDGQPYTEVNVSRDIVWYLLAHAEIEARERYKPSLNKALYLLQTNSFRFHWRITRRTFDKFWRRVAPSAAFEFVSQDASPFNWSLDPADPLMSDYINEIVDDRQGVIQYLSNCYWATNQLARILHPRAASQIAFPVFPDHLLPVEVEIERLPLTLIEKLRDFISQDTETYMIFDP